MCPQKPESIQCNILKSLPPVIPPPPMGFALFGILWDLNPIRMMKMPKKTSNIVKGD